MCWMLPFPYLADGRMISAEKDAPLLKGKKQTEYKIIVPFSTARIKRQMKKRRTAVSRKPVK